MLFSGYNFSILPEGSIEFDRELDLQKLNMTDNDKFVVQYVNNRVMLRKIPNEIHKLVQ